MYIIKDYKRLKTEENSRLSLNWNLNREISKLNYRVHTDAIKSYLIPPELTPAQVSFTYNELLPSISSCINTFSVSNVSVFVQ